MADQINVGPPPVQLRTGRSYKGFAIVAVLAALAVAGAVAWLSYGDRVAELASVGSGSSSSAAATNDSSLVAASEFQAFQQQTAETLQGATQLLTAQQAELQRLTNEVSGLTAKIDALQNTLAASRPAAAVASRPAPPAAFPPPAPPAAAAPVATAPAAAPRRRPVTPKPAGSISVGGAPLPPPNQPAR